MRLIFKSLLAAGVIGTAFSGGARAADEPPEHSFSGKVTLISEYEYRGLTQTAEKPAVQLNLDYAHKSGFYLGTFLTNISWIKDTKDEFRASSGKGPVEWDIFGGYKFEVVKDVTLDLGYLRYEYPSSEAVKLAGATILKKPNTNELYAGLTWTDFNVKYSVSTGDLFGFPDTKKSTFIEINWSKEVMEKLTLTAHLGRVKVKNASDFDYTVYRLGGTYDWNGWLLGAYIKGTDADGRLYTYKGKDWSKDRLVVSVAKTF